VRQDAGGITLW
jgi:hypothetical protein